MASWTTAHIPPQASRLSVITGATGGLGYETALALAAAGGDIVLTGRDSAKGETAVRRIRALHPSARVQFEHLDLASLASISAFSTRFAREHDALDLLVNNAGVMAPPVRHTTSDGFELQFGTNYLSHFALTAQLLPLLRQGRAPRVVNLSSLAHRSGAIQFDDLQWERRYAAWASYCQSKLAMLMFAFELQRRSDAHGWGLMSNAAHPGYAITGLQSAGPRLGRQGPGLIERVGHWLPFLSQSAADGALPTLYAATDPQATAAGYYGPKGLYEMKGPVTDAFVAKRAKDVAVAARLWEISEQLTGTSWPQQVRAIAS